ncbi:MAG TPA: hypothetical protein VI874_04595, partial [Candidatus Norongarragalinales archaeon]|nr:hypothetical protein [Candidatus Norongarragalinales archaeon]
MTLRFVYNEPAAVLKDALILADLHLGIEFELQQKGYHVGQQFPREAERINQLIRQTKTRQVIFLGDVKHNVYGMEDKEERVLNAFFRKLQTKKITV